MPWEDLIPRNRKKEFKEALGGYLILSGMIANVLMIIFFLILTYRLI